MRERGIILRRVTLSDPEQGYGPYYGYAVGTDPAGVEYLICDEGVGYPLPEAEKAAIQETGETVDLADFVRAFGSRLDVNVYRWANILNGDKS